MPDTGGILWAVIGGSFLVLLSVIGWFLNHGASILKGGMDDLAKEVKGLRGDIGRYHDSEMETKGDLKAHIQKCEERHKLLAAHYSLNPR